MWIEPLFFRAAAILPPGKKMVLGLDPTISPNASTGTAEKEVIDYVFVVADENRGGESFEFHHRFGLHSLFNHRHYFV